MKANTNTQKLKEAINRSGYTKGDIAKKLGISVQSLYNRINGKTEFYSKEISLLYDLLKLNSKQGTEIFFPTGSGTDAEIVHPEYKILPYFAKLKGKTVLQCAEAIGISEPEFICKVKGSEDFTAEQGRKLSKFLKVKQDHLFFTFEL